MSGFGDFDDDDAFDPTAPADPEQVARKLHRLRYDNSLESRTWFQMTPGERALRVAIVTALLVWLRRSGAT